MGIPDQLHYGSYTQSPHRVHDLSSYAIPPASYGHIHNAAKPSPSSSRKRKAITPSPSQVIDLTQDTPPKKRRTMASDLVGKLDGAMVTDTAKPKKQRTRRDATEERRLRRWRSHAPTSYHEIRDRALTQRMFVLERTRNTPPPISSTLSNIIPDLAGDHSYYPTETISLAGSTGNVYTIHINKVPSCDCPHALKGNQCKHIVYALTRVLRVPPHLEYQLAFLSAELREIFAHAPPLPSETAEKDGGKKDGNRKPLEGECPICCVDFDEPGEGQSGGGGGGEEIVYCKAACGNNVHRHCFEQWAATKKAGGTVTCPFCRTPWQGDEDMVRKIARTGKRNEEGYVNVASQLGLSGRRDYSTYHSYWVRRQLRNGELNWDDEGVMGFDY